MYGLGVVIYELITGKLPYRFADLSYGIITVEDLKDAKGLTPVSISSTKEGVSPEL